MREHLPHAHAERENCIEQMPRREEISAEGNFPSPERSNEPVRGKSV
jgi:hypothetical protein